jgi:hypothetical protein
MGQAQDEQRAGVHRSSTGPVPQVVVAVDDLAEGIRVAGMFVT